MTCPTCGRSSQDWRDRATRITSADGVKVRVREGEDRLEGYRRWHGTLGPRYVAADVDQVEWRDGRPVAILEMTMIEGAPNPPQAYFDGLMARKARDRENDRLEYLAAELNVRGYVVCYTRDLSEFHVTRIHPKLAGWRQMTREEYATWLKALEPYQRAEAA